MEMTAAAGREPVRHAEQSGGPTATLAEVDSRSELLTRPRRPSDSAGLDRALAVLARGMTENPRSMLQQLVEAAVELCEADTAGISPALAACASTRMSRS
jgi:hypothetical protein